MKRILPVRTAFYVLKLEPSRRGGSFSFGKIAKEKKLKGKILGASKNAPRIVAVTSVCKDF